MLTGALIDMLCVGSEVSHHGQVETAKHLPTVHTFISLSTMSLSELISSRAWTYFSERGEDALHAVKGAIGGSGSGKYLDIRDDKLALVRAKLESTHDVDRLDGMKSVVAMISKGRDATPYLASVFKLSSTTSLEVRKLVYLVVLRYAPLHPDLALLSINSFQRDLTDPNPLIRGMALRTLSGIQLDTVSEIVMLAVSKAIRDPHPYVRRIAAFALPKCYNLDDEHYDRILNCFYTLLQDRSPSVLGAAISVYKDMCHDRWDLLHRHFRKLCLALVDMDEWSQPLCIDVLTRYARANISKPSDKLVDADLDLLLTSLSTLAYSMNPAVVMAIVHAYDALFPERISIVFSALLRLLRGPPDVAYMATMNALALAQAKKVDIVPAMSSFYVRASDPAYLARSKLRVLVCITPSSHASKIANELSAYAHSPSIPLALDSVTALGLLARRFEEVSELCLQLLMNLAQEDTIPTQVLSRTVQIIKALVRVSSPSTAATIVTRFCLRLFVPLAMRGRSPNAPKIRILTDSASRASVLWMLGQYAELKIADESLLVLLVPEVLRCLVAHWQKEHIQVQCQALTLSAKAYVQLPLVSDANVRMAITVLHYEILYRASLSPNADVRLRARFYSGLTRGLANKDTELEAAPTEDVREYLASHQKLDLLRLPGVRLRRTQVQHILQAHVEFDSGDEFILSNDIFPTIQLRGFHASQLPDWSNPQTAPPAIVRAPDTNSIQQKDTWMENQRSFSSDMLLKNNTSPEAIVLQPRTSTVSSGPKSLAANARYKDLDSFLDEESESEDENETVEIDHPAPEDDDYMLDSSGTEYDEDD